MGVGVGVGVRVVLGFAAAAGDGVARAMPRLGTVMGNVDAVRKLKMLSTRGRIWRQFGITMLWPSAEVPSSE